MNGQPIYWDITAPPRYDPSRSVDAQVCPVARNLRKADTHLRFRYSSPPDNPTLSSCRTRPGTSVGHSELQLNSALLTLAAGVNPTQVQVVGLGTDSSCLTNVIAHSQDFTFTVAGSTAMCERSFELSWQDQVGTGPYNFTVLPLDSSTSPWDQVLTGGGTTTGAAEWAVNMTTGSRFTIMMK